MELNDKIVSRGIETEMRAAYIDYSMSVIVSRALPDVRDGLKPVHRRVLFGMSGLGLASNRPHKKSARVVGEVLGKYHPHGDTSVYDAMVRMAQEWSLRYMLVDGQGNFGSVDGDSPAAMRYTEARLRASAEELLADIEKNTVDFTPNFDDSLTEPSVLPAKLPNLLINGASGIAVGMATNMAPHNLKEVVAGTIAYINAVYFEKRSIEIAELMQHILAPDFPTGGIIYGVEGVRDAFMTGRGRIVVRGKANIEPYEHGRERIIIDEIPYQVNKAALVEKIAELRDTKKIEGIGDVRDESDRDGYRVVVEVKKDAMSNVVLNNLFKYTSLQMAFNVNNVCLVAGRPMQLNLKELIRYFVDHRHEVVIRRTQYELDEALQRAHILEGLIIALDNLDEVIALIRASTSPDIARAGLMERFGLSEIQAKAILDMRLQRLTGLEMDKIRAEYAELQKKIEYYREVLARQELRMGIIKDELEEVSRRFGDARRTQIEISGDELTMEDMIANEEVVISISRQGYIKRTSLSEYRVQKRGGTGARGTATKETDFIEHIFVASAHNYLLFFTEKGKCFWLRVFTIPEGGRATKGRAIQNLVQIEADDQVRAYINVPKLNNPEYLAQHSIIMCTERGVVKKTSLEAYSRPRTAGINAISVNEGDKLVSASLIKETSEVVIATTYGLANRFPASQVRDMGRTATGVRGIRLSEAKEDKVIGMVVVDDPETQLLVVSANGFGKRSPVGDYRITRRGSKGVRTLNITEKTGLLVNIVDVLETHDVMIMTEAGIVIRMSVRTIRSLGRNSQGVRLIKLRGEDAIAAVARLDEQNEETPESEEAKDMLVSELEVDDSTPLPETEEVEEGEEEAEPEE